MCGRYANRAEGRFNIPPGTGCTVVRSVDGQTEEARLTWGFAPHWLRDPTKAQINARAETIHEKPMFRDSFKHRRCLVPADGWYEWLRDGPVKQPWFFQLRDAKPFAFAGIWTGESFAIVTTAPTQLAAKVHGRMPVVLPGKDWEEWLGAHPQGPGRLQFLCRTREDLPLETWPVSAAVNRPQYNETDAVTPTGDMERA